MNQSSLMKPVFYRPLTLLVLCLAGTGMLQAAINVTECGQAVVTDAVLVNDLVCDTGEFESVAVSIAASNLTLNLDGHVISGHPGGIGIKAVDVEGIVIRNGTIESFLSGIDLIRTFDVIVENLTIKNLESDDPNDFVDALRINASQDIVVRDSIFEFLLVAHKNGILLANSQTTIDNIEMIGGGVGVDISGDCTVDPKGSTTAVINSNFVNVTIAGVLAQCTENSRVANNRFTSNEMGVLVDNSTAGNITGLVIEGNYIHGGHLGIDMLGNTECSVVNNVIRNNWRGISLRSNMECAGGPPGPDCFYATGNVITRNRVTGNFLDLYHHENAVGNTWEDNICQTNEGVEIPECIAIHIDSFEGL